MSKKNIFIIGDSHTDAIKKSLDKQKKFPYDFNVSISRFSKIKNGKEIGDISVEDAIKFISTLKKTDLVISVIGGNQHSTLGLVQHPIPFDIHMDNENIISDDYESIPYAVIWDIFENGIRGKDGKRLLKIRDAAQCDVYHISPPPPKSSTDHIMKRHETSFASAGILDKGITPAAIRYKLWVIQVRVLRALCIEWGITFMPAPVDSLCPDGFLKPEYYANDATHANKDYGQLIMDQIAMLS